MSQESWLQKTVEVPAAVNALLEKYGRDRIDEIGQADQYALATASLALALNDGLEKMGGPQRKRRRASGPLFDSLLNVLPVIFMMGYDFAKREIQSPGDGDA